jgi:hypothetical protein
MSLNWDISKVRNNNEVCKINVGTAEQRLNPVTEGLIYATLTVGLGEITEKNVDEWMLRLGFTDRLHGTLLKKDRQDRPFTREEVVAHIGLRTNVSKETRAKFIKRHTESYFRDAEYYQRQEAEQKKAG